jgi:phage-related protein
MQARAAAILIVAVLFVVVAVLYRVMRNALQGIASAGRAGRYLRSSVAHAGFEPDTVIGWLLAIMSMLLAIGGLIVVVVKMLRVVW